MEQTDTLKVEEEEDQLKEFHSSRLNSISFRIALTAIFTSLAVVFGYLLATIPNIELFTLVIFLSGFVIGKKEGLIIGALSSFLFCGFNPMGMSSIPLLTYQMIHYSLVGLMGGFAKYYLTKKPYFVQKHDMFKWKIVAVFGCMGFSLTLIYQIFASLVGYLFVFTTTESFLLYFMSGIIFTIIHIVGNTLGFIYILPALIQLCSKMID
ncbi:MAG: hypothetical protein JW891_02625 [Candidatus Lokiarchaeota archaeon]|nr:hypothetical protein [Candidatus Lokiarchaeota archaeon]